MSAELPLLDASQSTMAWRFWHRGMNTLQIAIVLSTSARVVSEAAVFNTLRRLREDARAGKVA